MNARVRALVERARAGDAAGVELELHAWTRRDDCPSAVRVALAAMLTRRGQHDAALRVLRLIHEQPDRDIDQDVLQTRLAVLIDAGMNDSARRLAERLHRVHGHRPGVRQWIEGTQLPGADKLPNVAPEAVETLAAELVDDPDVVRSLVAGMKHDAALTDGTRQAEALDQELAGVPQPDAAVRPIALLRAAIERIHPGYADDPRRQTMLCTALAELALLAHDTNDARRWAHRGLKVDPYCASLALVLASCDDEPSLGPPARQALARVARQHPGYPDVRAAMIRRAFDEGRTASARRRLTAWLRRDPDSTLAQQLQQELAA